MFGRVSLQLSLLTLAAEFRGDCAIDCEDIKQAHAAAIESYIEKHVGFDLSGAFRAEDEIGSMYFTRTLEDWARFNINNRTKFDASISSGLAIMACQKSLYQPVKKKSKIKLNFAKYDNKGSYSQIIR